MLREVKIRDFRRFKNYTFGGLRRINLLVGPNGAGKTSLLEAVGLLHVHDSVSFLADAALRRWELLNRTGASNPESQNPQVVWPEANRTFHSFLTKPGATYRIDGVLNAGLPAPPGTRPGQVKGESVSFTASIVSVSEFPQEYAHFRYAKAPNASIALKVELDRNGQHVRYFALVSPDGALHLPGLVDPPTLTTAQEWAGKSNGMFAITPALGLLPMQFLSEWWDWIEQKRLEHEVSKALSIVSVGRKIEKVTLPKGNPSLTAVAAPAFKVGIEGEPELVPIGTLGDGVSRMLQLSMALLRTSGAVLLTDEIEMGLHYASHPSLWELVIRTAARQNVQVFATTHSLDCVRGLGYLLDRWNNSDKREERELAEEVAIHGINPLENESATYETAEIIDNYRREIEVR